MRINKLSLLSFLCLIFSNYCFSQSLESSKGFYLNDGVVNESVTISFSGGPGNAKDWVGIYKEGQTPGDVDSTIWSYVDGTKSGDTGKSDGVIIFQDRLEVGSYKAYFLEDDEYNILGSASFVVTAVLSEDVFFQEDFDGVELRAFVSDSESNGDGTDWSAEGPSGWVMRKNAGHGSTDGGDVVVEFDGWTFLDPVSWNATAGQDRSLFSKGSGVIAVADSDEYDDKADAKFSASLSTPPIDISKASLNTLILQYDSSWRKEPQTGSVTVSYDGGAEIELLSLDGNNADALNETVELELKNPSGAKSAVISWNYQGYNNWWWAIDNVKVRGEEKGNTAPVVADQGVDVDEDGSVSIILSGSDEEGDSLSYTVLTQPKNGTLSGTAPSLSYSPNANYSGSDSFSYKANDGAADSNTATVTIKVIKKEEDEPVLSLSKAEYRQGEVIEVSFSGGPGNAKDWVGIYKEGELNEDDDILEWLYVDGTEEGNEAKTEGAVSVEADLAPGSYQVSLFENDGGDILATAGFKVKAGSGLGEGIYFEEDFDELVLGAFESDSESGGDGTDWTAQGPSGWTMVKGGGHGPTAGGEAVKEFDGWTFMDPVSWDATAGQDRAQFKKGQGVIAVADSDEYDDKADAKFDAWLSTPEIDITGAGAGTLVLSYDSSWRQEPQTGSVTVSYDGGAEVTLLELGAGKATAYDETVELDLKNPAGAKTAVISWDHQGHNNWWWAIDNVKVYGETKGNTAPVVADQSVNVEEDGSVSITLSGSDEDGDSLSFTVLSQPKNGTLSGTAPALTYRPNANYSGSDSFSYKGNDGAADSNTATVSIRVIENLDGPSVIVSKITYDYGERIRITYSGGPGNQKDWIGLFKEGKNGTWPPIKFQQLKGQKSGIIEWDLKLEKGKKYDVAFYNKWTFTRLDLKKFSISTKNVSKPTARSQKLNARSGKEYNVKLEGSDFDGDTISYRIVSKPKHGTLSGTAPNLIYKSNTDYAGFDSFTYVANDGELDSEIATVNFEVNNKKPKKWTILVYNQGDSNLAKWHLIQTKEFQRLGSNNNVNVIIQSDYNINEKRYTKGFVEQYDEDYDNVSNGVTRIVVGENVNNSLPKTTPVVERLPEGSRSENRMDDPRVFGEFLDWGIANYPAERYALLLFDHGGSFYGFGGDDQDGLGGANALKPRAFRKEIQRSLDIAGVEKFDFINFFACLMGATEVLDAFDGLCDVFYGNPEIAWYYHIRGRLKYIDILLNNPDIDNIALAEHEVEEWLPGNFGTDNAIGMHCAYDMSKYGAFKTAFNSFTDDLLAEYPKNNGLINAARRNTTPYWKKTIAELKTPSSFIDLAHFAEILSNNVVGKLKGSSVALLDNINDMIIDKHLGSKRPEVAGLSIYYPVNGLAANSTTSWDYTYFAKGTGGNWSNYLRQVNSVSGSESDQTEFVLNSDGELVARNAEFGMAENGLMSASTSRPVEIEFELESAEKAYDYFINLVSNRETDDPNQFVYLGELHRGLIEGKKKHQYNWDTRLPVLSLEGGGAKAPPVGSVGVDRKELIGEMPLYLGGWWSELSDDLMISYADYQGPGEGEKTHLILTTKYLEGGAGVLDSVMLDSSLENQPPVGAGENENQVAPVGVDFEFEPGAKLWPVYYMEEPDPENPGEWKPYFTWFKDGYIKIPENGKDGLVINWESVEPGDYRAEVQVSDFNGNLSEELKFDIRVEGDLKSLPGLVLTLEGARVVLSWGMEDGGDEAILQWADGLGGEWVDVPSSDLGFGGAGRLYKESAKEKTRFYRLIKR